MIHKEQDMGLQDKWAAARERNRQVHEAERARHRRYMKALELQGLGLKTMTASGLPSPALTEEDLDAMLAAEKKRRAEMFETFTRVKTLTRFQALGVQIPTGGDQVYTIGAHNIQAKTNASRLLGPLAGARAKVTDGTSSFSWGKAALMPLATAPLARKETADAMVVFADGTVHTVGLNGSYQVREARKQTVQFNALAGTAAPPAEETTSDPAAKLRKLQELLDEGLLSREEYEAKRAQIINSI
jgi:hypothetical protein